MISGMVLSGRGDKTVHQRGKQSPS